MVKLTDTHSPIAAVWVQKTRRPTANIKGNCEPKSLTAVKLAAKLFNFNSLLSLRVKR